MSILNCRHFSPGGIITVLGPCIQDGLYSLVNLPGHHLRINLATAMSLSTTNQLKRERVMKLHEKFGHLSKLKMRIALAQQPVDGLQPKDLDLWVECAVCAEANSQAVPHPKKAIVKTSFYGQRIDWDLTGPQPGHSNTRRSDRRHAWSLQADKHLVYVCSTFENRSSGQV